MSRKNASLCMNEATVGGALNLMSMLIDYCSSWPLVQS
jgi:hypothetical protein